MKSNTVLPAPLPDPNFVSANAPKISVTKGGSGKTSTTSGPTPQQHQSRRHIHKARSPKKVTSGVRIAGAIRNLRRRRSKQLLEIETLIEDDIAEVAQEELEELDMSMSPEGNNDIMTSPTTASRITTSTAEDLLVANPSPFISYLAETPMKTDIAVPIANPFDVILARSAQSAQEFQRSRSPEKPPVVTTEQDRPAAIFIQTTSSFASQVTTALDGNTVLPETSVVPTKSLPAPFSNTPVSFSRAQQRQKNNPYAPAVPSPLSRILRMSDSPLGRSVASDNDPAEPDQNVGSKWNLTDVLEEEEDNGTVNIVRNPPISLAEELGLPAYDAEHRGSPSAFERGTRINRTPSPRKFSSKETDKANEVVAGSPPRTSAAVFKVREKENMSPSKTKITIGRRVVGGGATRAAMIPNLPSRRTAGAGGLKSASGAGRIMAPTFRSMRDEVKARQSTVSRRAGIS